MNTPNDMTLRDLFAALSVHALRVAESLARGDASTTTHTAPSPSLDRAADFHSARAGSNPAGVTTTTDAGRAGGALSGDGRDQAQSQPARASQPAPSGVEVGEGREPSRQAAPASAPSKSAEDLAVEAAKAWHDRAVTKEDLSFCARVPQGVSQNYALGHLAGQGVGRRAAFAAIEELMRQRAECAKEAT